MVESDDETEQFVKRWKFSPEDHDEDDAQPQPSPTDEGSSGTKRRSFQDDVDRDMKRLRDEGSLFGLSVDYLDIVYENEIIYDLASMGCSVETVAFSMG